MVRITQKKLREIAADTVDRQTRSDRTIIAAYLIGSVLQENAFLGGAADIDLVFVHGDEPEITREIVRLTDDVHLDILHHGQLRYHEGRKLRTDTDLGALIYPAKILFDPHHLLDFTQASIRGQYHRPDFVLSRSQSNLELARQLWTSFESWPQEPGPRETHEYLGALKTAANSVTNLAGGPLTERRMLLEFDERTRNLDQHGLHMGLLGLLGGTNADVDSIEMWLSAWDSVYEHVGAHAEQPAHLHRDRKLYYRRAIEVLGSSAQPLAGLWPLLITWTELIWRIPSDTEYWDSWVAACQRLELVGRPLKKRLLALDAYLDTIEELLEGWGNEHGA